MIAHIEGTTLIDYRRRRDALNGWTITPASWQHLTNDLQREQTPLQRRPTNWGDRKRLTASALVWVQVTCGEHLFANHHYPRLQRVLQTYASELAARIDHHPDI